MAKLIDLSDIAVEDLYEGGKIWIDSMLRQPMRVVAVHIVMARVKPEQLGLCDKPEIVRAFNADYAAVRLAYYVKDNPEVRKMRPHLKLATATRCYDFSAQLENGEKAEFSINIRTGRPMPRETDERKYIRRGYGIPGNAAAIADWVISDRSEDEMSFWEWRNKGVPRRVDHHCPHLDVIEQDGKSVP
ncbi:hypothetical protein [Agrobacterium tumefaciens]|uniref:hypothetical protein n=1 Tax=Agrobacterium tumefaciens TaxID=358 RepID=UPI001F37AA93